MLKIEVLKFEAQDIITSSIPVACICGKGECDPEDNHSLYKEGAGLIYCPASVHTGCPEERPN